MADVRHDQIASENLGDSLCEHHEDARFHFWNQVEDCLLARVQMLVRYSPLVCKCAPVQVPDPSEISVSVAFSDNAVEQAAPLPIALFLVAKFFDSETVPEFCRAGTDRTIYATRLMILVLVCGTRTGTHEDGICVRCAATAGGPGKVR